MTESEREAHFRTCAADLRPMLWRLTGGYAPEAQREDLLQEILLQVWLALPRFEGRAKLSTWAYRVGLLTALNWSRKHRRRDLSKPLDDHPEVAATTSDPAVRDELARALEIMRHELEELDRAVLLLALEDLPRQQMADILGLSVNAVTTRLSRARTRLSERLQSPPAR